MTKGRKFKWIAGTLNQPESQILAQDCNVIVFYNTGSIDCRIMGNLLVVGATLTLGGWQNEVDSSTYAIQWTSTSGGQLQYFRKVYLD